MSTLVNPNGSYTTEPNILKENLAKLYDTVVDKRLICVYTILTRENHISTKRVVELAFTSDFEKECITCASADSVYRALKKLQEQGFIIGQLTKAGYVWQILLD
jgi:Fe2+ or Zn2+ uptake regulation protein